jgi:hypothetical protein
MSRAEGVRAAGYQQADASLKEEMDLVEEDAPVREFSSIKPLVSDAVRLATSSHSSPPPSASRVMYGNDMFYLFFRLHHYLYDGSATPLSVSSSVCSFPL